VLRVWATAARYTLRGALHTQEGKEGDEAVAAADGRPRGGGGAAMNTLDAADAARGLLRRGIAPTPVPAWPKPGEAERGLPVDGSRWDQPRD
jgi:hypothetical protein